MWILFPVVYLMMIIKQSRHPVQHKTALVHFLDRETASHILMMSLPKIRFVQFYIQKFGKTNMFAQCTVSLQGSENTHLALGAFTARTELRHIERKVVDGDVVEVVMISDTHIPVCAISLQVQDLMFKPSDYRELCTLPMY